MKIRNMRHDSERARHASPLHFRFLSAYLSRVVIDVDVRMMVFPVGDVGDTVDEIHRFEKMPEGEMPFDGFFFQYPLRDFFPPFPCFFR